MKRVTVCMICECVCVTVCVILLGFSKGKVPESIQYATCRITKKGTEYMGKISETKSGLICEYWESSSLSDLYSSEHITDHDFPDGNKRNARNFCRNPVNASMGPWCFTKSRVKENCIVPICSISEDCRLTGPGMEYFGKIHKTIYDNECLHWAATSNAGKVDEMLPEGNVILAGKFCRNPTGQIEGPWCYVLGDEFEMERGNKTWGKELCDVPLCFNQPYISVIQKTNNNNQYYTHFSSIKYENEIPFSVKLWNPEDWRNGEIKIGLSSLAVPVNGNELRRWDIGYEVILRNIKGGVTPKNDEDESWEDKPGILSGLSWSHLKLGRSNGFITLSAQGKEKSYYIHEYKDEANGILSEEKAQIKFISVIGTMAFFNLSQEESYCEEHITTSMDITRYWLMSITSLNKFLEFHLRCWVNCAMQFKIAPPQEYPKVQLTFDEEGGKTSLSIYNDDNQTRVASALLSHIISYWKWNEYSISISGSRFLMMVTTKSGVETIFDVKDKIFQAIKWYGIASSRIAHWTFFCKPTKVVYEALPPECSVSNTDMDYEGHQWITQSGLPCLPWRVDFNDDLDNAQFQDGSITSALNYCRNPTTDIQGAFCYTRDLISNTITKERCAVRKCKFKDCRIAGTANDFMGKISSTISGRTCQPWESQTPHSIDKALLDNELYPERSVNTASNYCRDPSKNVAGPWCYTMDPQVEKDLCNVPDCYRAAECTVIVTTSTRKKVFLVPHWRSQGLPLWVKMWNPDIVTTLVLFIYPIEGSYKYKLVLGDDENETIKLFHISESGNEILLKEKTSSHFLSSGRWVGILIGLQDREINIRYEGVPAPFFIWQKGINEDLPGINAMYFSYEGKSKDDKGSLGLSFPCDVCQTEICLKDLNHYAVFYPINVWMENSSSTVKNLSFYIRGNGLFTVNLYLLPSKFPHGKLIIDDGSSKDLMEIQLIRRRYLDRVAMKHKGSPAITNDYWTEVTLTIDGNLGSLILNGTMFMNWTYPRVPLFYYFTVTCTDKITWVANCQPPVLDGTPVDGGWSSWSPWECSATCGGGRGIRRRYCNRPEPTMYGKTCAGSPLETGICNENLCGKTSISTINLVRDSLAKHANNIQIFIHQRINIQCNPKLLKIIAEESPKTLLHWNKNGVKISADLLIEDVDPDNFQLEIKAANVSDNGVYACVAVGDDQEHEIVDVTALIVRSVEYTMMRRVGERLILNANSLLLNSIYSNLRLTWFLNDHIYKEYAITDLRLVNEEIIEPIKVVHAGRWNSSVYQDQLNLNWTTSWYNLDVKGKANLATYILNEDLLEGRLGTSEIVVYIISALLLFIAIGTATAVTIFIIRLRKYFKNRSHN